MRRHIERLEQFAIDVILERRYGKRAALLRKFLWAVSKLFEQIVQLRLTLYRKRVLPDASLGCLVISVGNLTVGGTGKTPIVEKLARTLHNEGRKVAILSRGYKSRKAPLLRRIRNRFLVKRDPHAPRIVSDGNKILLGSREAGDEPYMLAKNLPGVAVLVDKDRVKCGQYAISHFGADTLILDDGLQYLRLHHRLNLVLVDRWAPFGTEFLLPRGTLREPPKNLRRADYIFLTKSPEDPAKNKDVIKRIRRYNRTAEIIACAHRPRYLQEVYGNRKLPLTALNGKYIGAFSAIAAPEGFEFILKQLGANVELSRRFIDHHRFTEEEIRNFSARCFRRDIQMILTTEKDAVRFPNFASVAKGVAGIPKLNLEVPIFYLRVEIEILGGHENWKDCVDRICHAGML